MKTGFYKKMIKISIFQGQFEGVTMVLFFIDSGIFSYLEYLCSFLNIKMVYFKGLPLNKQKILTAVFNFYVKKCIVKSNLDGL